MQNRLDSYLKFLIGDAIVDNTRSCSVATIPVDFNPCHNDCFHANQGKQCPWALALISQSLTPFYVALNIMGEERSYFIGKSCLQQCNSCINLHTFEQRLLFSLSVADLRHGAYHMES